MKTTVDAVLDDEDEDVGMVEMLMRSLENGTSHLPTRALATPNK